MNRFAICFICVIAVLALVIAGIAQDGQNTTSARKVLRVGLEKTKALNNLDVYGSKSLYNTSMLSRREMTPAFNASQRLGMTSKFSYSTEFVKSLYNISQYSRTKPIYQIPSFLKPKSLYNITGYPKIMAPASIP